MTGTTDIELKDLIQDLEKDSTNLDLINSVAIGYFENYDQKTDKEDYDHFEKAYDLKKTIKSTHNFAWYLYFEWSEIEWRWKQDTALEKAIEIQKECLELNPKSFYPYYQFGYMLLDQKKFKDAIPYLEKATLLEKQRDILHNIGYCHFQLGNFKKANLYFSNSATDKDTENRSLFNLALTAFNTNNLDQVKSVAKKLSNDIEYNVHKTISGYEIGLLFFLLKDYHKATECLVSQGIDGIDLMDWSELSYALYNIDKNKWKEQISQSIEERTKWIEEIKSGHEDWDEYSKDEKQERRVELQTEVKHRQEILENGITEPKLDLIGSLLVEYCGCLLFDCKRHANRKDD